jgi:hypothetical protein
MNIFEKLEAQENNFLNSQFLSPVIKNTPVRVRIANIILNFKISKPKNFTGWGVFTPINYKEAKLIRQPNLTEKQQYLELFPCIRFVLCRKIEENWFGVPAYQSDSRFKITGTVPIFLLEEIQIFDTIQTRFDGSVFWFESQDYKKNQQTANYLRESLQNEIEPKNLSFTGLTQEEKDAYLISFNDEVESKKDKNEEKIKNALEHAGAKYRSYIERNSTYTIEYSVDNEIHHSVINKNTFQVQSAGICLSGGDRAFDITSLVGVIKEGRRNHRIVRVNL